MHLKKQTFHFSHLKKFSLVSALSPFTDFYQQFQCHTLNADKVQQIRGVSKSVAFSLLIFQQYNRRAVENETAGLFPFKSEVENIVGCAVRTMVHGMHPTQ
jgi:hypothetical protein